MTELSEILKELHPLLPQRLITVESSHCVCVLEGAEHFIPLTGPIPKWRLAILLASMEEECAARRWWNMLLVQYGWDIATIGGANGAQFDAEGPVSVQAFSAALLRALQAEASLNSTAVPAAHMEGAPSEKHDPPCPPPLASTPHPTGWRPTCESCKHWEKNLLIGYAPGTCRQITVHGQIIIDCAVFKGDPLAQTYPDFCCNRWTER